VEEKVKSVQRKYMLQEQLKVFTLYKYSLEAPVSIPWIMDQLFGPAANSENKLLDAQKN
jgi:hypothetical protein